MRFFYCKHFCLVFWKTFRGILSLGCVLIALSLYFYPGISSQNNINNFANNSQMIPIDSMNDKINADTILIIREVIDNMSIEYYSEKKFSNIYIGMKRSDLLNQIELINKSPGLQEKEKGFLYCQVTYFSADKVELTKYYDGNLYRYK